MAIFHPDCLTGDIQACPACGKHPTDGDNTRLAAIVRRFLKHKKHEVVLQNVAPKIIPKTEAKELPRISNELVPEIKVPQQEEAQKPRPKLELKRQVAYQVGMTRRNKINPAPIDRNGTFSYSFMKE